MKKLFLLSTFVLLSTSYSYSQFLTTNNVDNWNNLWKSGFYESVNLPSAPSIGNQTHEWFWGINISHSANSANYRYNGQIAIANTNILNKQSMFFRCTDEFGKGTWSKVLNDQGNQTINEDLTLNGKLTSRVNRVADWNNIWESGYYESTEVAKNAPIANRWYWGINIGCINNSQTNKENSQILIEHNYDNPTMYIRNTPASGTGKWVKVITDNGAQKIKGNLTVAGTINAKEIRVNVNAGADYVFHPDYNLKSLSELKTFVEENKHLPDIPSEKEMQEKGVNVNEFYIKLIQKIEELTLYTIKQQEMMVNQQTMINNQQKEINQLKSEIKK